MSISQNLVDPQRWNRYAYAGNNPLTFVDPDGRNWFSIGNHWEWHSGDSYTYKDGDGKEQTVKSSVEYLLVFQPTGTNQDGATVGSLTLFHQNSVLLRSTAFTGGVDGADAIPGGTYKIRLDIRGELGMADLRADRTLKNFYGIQEIPGPIGGRFDARYEWGSIRAKLNANPDEGFYLHGKQRPHDNTHGCICERSEAVLRRLFQLDYRTVPMVPVWVRGGR